MTPVTPPDDNPLYHWIVDGLLGVWISYQEWARRRLWDSLATKADVMAAIAKHAYEDDIKDEALIARAIKPLQEEASHLHEDLKEIKNDIKTILRSLGRLEGGD